jgi:Mrp family chromosome partitioning ATPase
VGPGLCELLRGQVDLDRAIAATPIEDLKLIAAGTSDRQAIRNLARGDLGPILGRIKERFDFVIVDSSPILPVAETMLVAQQADAVVFSIFRELSRKTQVFAALQRLQSLNVPILGAVVTGAHGGLYGNGYYDYSSNSRYTYPALPETAAQSPDLS